MEPLEKREMLAGNGLVNVDQCLDPDQGVRDRPYSWLPDGWFDGNKREEPTRPTGAARQYTKFMSRLEKRRLTAADICGLSFVIRKKSEFRDASRTFMQIVEGGGSDAQYERLHRRIVKATPHPSVLFDALDFQVFSALRFAKEKPDFAASRFAWPLASALLSTMRAYEATGQERFLELFVRGFDGVLQTRQLHMKRTEDNRGHRMKTWGVELDTGWTAFITFVGRLGYPAGLFAEAVNSDKALRATYGKKARRYVAAIEESLAEFEEDYRTIRKGREGYYVRGAMGDVEPLNHLHTVGNTLVLLHAVTGKEAHRVRAEQIANYFKSAIRVEKNGTYTWGYQPTPKNRTDHAPEMIYKAEVTIGFPVVAHEYGIGFTKKEVSTLARSFIKNVYQKSGDFNVWIGADRYHADAPGAKRLRDRLTSVAGWMVLDQVAPKVGKAVEATMIRRRDLFPDAWMTDAKTMELYAYRLKNRQSATKKAARSAPERQVARTLSPSAFSLSSAVPAPTVATGDVRFGSEPIKRDGETGSDDLLTGSVADVLS